MGNPQDAVETKQSQQTFPELNVTENQSTHENRKKITVHIAETCSCECDIQLVMPLPMIPAQ